MAAIRVETFVAAPPDVVFDLARDVRVHEKTTSGTGERVLEGPPSGMLELGDEVVFEAVHFGVRQRLRSKIVAYERPLEFVDEMQKGAFKSLRHVHRFEPVEGGTLMVDLVDFQSPGWVFGRLVDSLVLARYMGKFIEARGLELKRIAEASDPAP